MSDQVFPSGKFNYTVGEHSPVVDIYEGGKVTLSLEGEIIVVSKYWVTGEVFDVEDVEGIYASPELGVGRYKWKLDGSTLTFELMEDHNPSRPKSFAVPWHRVE